MSNETKLSKLIKSREEFAYRHSGYDLFPSYRNLYHKPTERRIFALGMGILTLGLCMAIIVLALICNLIGLILSICIISFTFYSILNVDFWYYSYERNVMLKYAYNILELAEDESKDQNTLVISSSLVDNIRKDFINLSEFNNNQEIKAYFEKNYPSIFNYCDNSIFKYLS